MQASPGGVESAGEVLLVFGDGEIGVDFDTYDPHPDVLRLAGSSELELTGVEIWMADVTGDGLGDLLVGRQNFSAEAPVSRGCGALTIVTGGPELRAHAATMEPVDLADPPEGLRVLTLFGEHSFDRLGIWMRSGDVDGDGTDDIVVSAPPHTEECLLGSQVVAQEKGVVYLILGGAHLAVRDEVTISDATHPALQNRLARLLPPDECDEFFFGGTVETGDLDGNGRAEVAVAAVLFRSSAQLTLSDDGGSEMGGRRAGEVYLFWDDNFPPPPWPEGFAVTAGAPPGTHTVIRGDEPLTNAFGESMQATGDYDGDGAVDLFIGDLSGEGSNGPYSGVGFVFFDAPESLRGRSLDLDDLPEDVVATTIHGPYERSLGSDASLVGDFNGDGIDDLALGSPHDSPEGRDEAGSGHVIFGRRGGWPAEIDLATDQLPPRSAVEIAMVAGAYASTDGDMGDTIFYSGAVGDYDGDGMTDLMINEMVGNGTQPDRIDIGNLVIISGKVFAAIGQAPGPAILNVAITGPDELTLEFSAPPGQSYALECSGALGAWEVLLDDIPGAPGPQSLTVTTSADASEEFFRIRVAGGE
jgi:hypothetical protein